MFVTFRTQLIACLLCLLATAGLGQSALAAESVAVVSAHARVSLVSDADAVAPGEPVHLGLLIRLAPGWHTYWSNPGDAGAAPTLALTLPPGAAAGPLAWPAPQRTHEGTLTTYAYSGELLLTTRVIPPPSSRGMLVNASASWLVCKDICVPEQGEFRLDLPPGRAVASAQAPLFIAAARKVPRPSPWAAHVAPDGTFWVRGPELSRATVAQAWFIPAEPNTIQDDATQRLTVTDGGFALALAPGSALKPGRGLAGVLAVLDRSGQETDVAVAAAPARTAPGWASDSRPPVWRLLGLAFLGGLILNLMPCVFPVLAIKALGLAEAAARGRRAGHALTYTAGVLVAFVALGAALIAARDAGAAAGWGFQFASPAFVAGLAWLLFAIGLNLSGVFRVGGGFEGAGQELAARGGGTGSFFTGLLAVVVATPCTAPFMAAAIAGGLAAPPAAAIGVFLALGLGLAAPYAALATVPGLVRALPRPGRWMEVLRQVLAFPMYGAAAWLVWVLSEEAGPVGVLAAVTGLVLLGFAAWALGAAQAASGRGSRRVGMAAAAAGGVGLVALLATLAGNPLPIGPTAAIGAGAEPFSAGRLAALRAEGRPVFVDMTAAWCVTCLINERLAIDAASVRREFDALRVAYLKGDWTRQDPAITDFLRAHGRDGVPLYVYFPAGGADPVVLPQILTAETVLEELRKG